MGSRQSGLLWVPDPRAYGNRWRAQISLAHIVCALPPSPHKEHNKMCVCDMIWAFQEEDLPSQILCVLLCQQALFCALLQHQVQHSGQASTCTGRKLLSLLGADLGRLAVIVFLAGKLGALKLLQLLPDMGVALDSEGLLLKQPGLKGDGGVVCSGSYNPSLGTRDPPCFTGWGGSAREVPVYGLTCMDPSPDLYSHAGVHECGAACFEKDLAHVQARWRLFTQFLRM
eukprot:429051-Pelagomonas_calceolata.AAC.1